MIDTDKYEGHYTDDFAIIWFRVTTSAMRELFADIELNADIDIERASATTRLIYDAPLLLAEVKRLRKELESIQNSMAWTVQVWWNENYMGREGWMEQMCEVYADLAIEIEAQYHGDEEE